MFHLEYPLDRLRPADYNPRSIDDEARAALAESLRVFGPIRALIARDNGTLVAGHQRLNALRALGIARAPVYVLAGLGEQDEVRFNQLHNAADIETADCRLSISSPAGPLSMGWQQVPFDAIRVDVRPKYAAKLNEILRLLARFGEWGNSVATRSGRVLVSPLYALACQILRRPLRVFAVEDQQAAGVLAAFTRGYGQFCYAALGDETWSQTLAQMRRLRKPKGRTVHSRTYETVVIPRIKKGQRILDFGAGQKDYAKRLAKAGHDILAVEFYLRRAGSMEFDVPQVHADISALCAALRTRGRFDVVVCDSVLNSVTSPEAESHVLRTINGLCRLGGLIVFSGRSRAFVERSANNLRNMKHTQERRVQFLDANGIGAMYQQGVWLRQKFHRRADVVRLARGIIGAQANVADSEGSTGREFNASAWHAWGEKTTELASLVVGAALDYEFNLPLPPAGSGRAYGRSAEVLDAWRTAMAREHSRTDARRTENCGT